MQIDLNTPVIQDLQSALREGQKTALFIGRDDRQSLPVEEGWRWFSLNETVNVDPPLATHIVMDFNDENAIARIYHLFNKVVFDWSTVKFCSKPMALVHNLLINDESSEAVLEQFARTLFLKTDPQYFAENLYYNVDSIEDYSLLKQNESRFDEWKLQVGEQEVQKRKEALKAVWDGSCFAQEDLEHEFNIEFMYHILETENLEATPFDHASVLLNNAELILRDKYFNSVTSFTGLYPHRDDGKLGRVWILKAPKSVKQFILNNSLKKAENCLDKLL